MATKFEAVAEHGTVVLKMTHDSKGAVTQRFGLRADCASGLAAELLDAVAESQDEAPRGSEMSARVSDEVLAEIAASKKLSVETRIARELIERRQVDQRVPIAVDADFEALEERLRQMWDRAIEDLKTRDAVACSSPTKPENTVQVRIAVEIGPNGSWSAHGWMGASDDEMTSTALDMVLTDEEPHAEVRFVTADVPLPEPQEIAGTVEGD